MCGVEGGNFTPNGPQNEVRAIFPHPPRDGGWESPPLFPPRRISLPRKGRRVGLYIVLFEACSAFTHVAACTLALSPIRDTLIEGFSHLVTSMTAPIASGWSDLPGGTFTHWNVPPCHGAHPERSLARPASSRWFSTIDRHAGRGLCGLSKNAAACGIVDLNDDRALRLGICLSTQH